MICSLKSSFYRFVRTGMLTKVLVFSALIGLAVIINTCLDDMMMYLIRRPRYVDNTFIITNVLKLVYVIPFASAVFCSVFTGSEISMRSVNNKIATGITRFSVYLSELAVSVVATVLSVIVSFAAILLFAQYVPVKENVKINKQIILLVLSVTIICIAFTALFLWFQLFFRHKFIALACSLVMVLTVVTVSPVIGGLLEEPYRYYVMTDEEAGTYEWLTNPYYIGGTLRNVLTFVYDSSPYNFDSVTDLNSFPQAAVTAGMIFVLTSATGMVSVKKKEFL